ncbi:MAG: IS200/IS605 family transposase [Cyanobacteria bacterium P01_F01_bin.53]
MKDIGSLSHTRWECKYHVVFIPKYRRKAMYKDIRAYLGKVFHELARRKESRIEEGHLCTDHVHMLLSIPPKYAVSQVVGFIKGKSAIAIARNYSGGRRNMVGQKFWARGYYVSTVGHDEALVRRYIQTQETEEHRLEQLRLSDEW